MMMEPLPLSDQIKLAKSMFPDIAKQAPLKYLSDYLVRAIINTPDKVKGMTITIDAGIGTLDILDGLLKFTAATGDKKLTINHPVCLTCQALQSSTCQITEQFITAVSTCPIDRW